MCARSTGMPRTRRRSFNRQEVSRLDTLLPLKDNWRYCLPGSSAVGLSSFDKDYRYVAHRNA